MATPHAEFIKDIMDRQKNGLLSIGSKFDVDVDVEEYDDDLSDDEEKENSGKSNNDKKDIKVDSSFLETDIDVQRRSAVRETRSKSRTIPRKNSPQSRINRRYVGVKRKVFRSKSLH